MLLLGGQQNSNRLNRACQRTALAGKIPHAPVCRDGGIGRRSGLKIHRPTKACEFESRSRHIPFRFIPLLIRRGT